MCLHKLNSILRLLIFQIPLGDIFPEGLIDRAFQHFEPILYLPPRVYVCLVQLKHFAFNALQSLYITTLFLENDFGDALETFFYIFLDGVDLIGFGEDLDEFIVGEEIKSGEFVSFFLKILLKFFLDLGQSVLETDP